jgi:hypothetical protein
MLVLRMKNMRTICVHHYAGLMTRSVAISCDMIAGVKNVGCVTGFNKFAGDHCTRKTSPDNGKSH